MKPTLSIEEIKYIKKALAANEGETDIAKLTDGPALSMQFLDKTMATIAATEDDFAFLKQMPTRSTDQALVEFNKYQSHGNNSHYHSSYVGQGADPAFHDVILERLYDEMTYLAEGFSVNKAIRQVKNVNDPETVQSTGATLRLMTSLQRTIWFGDKALNPLESNGFMTLIQENSENVYDLRGQLFDVEAVATLCNRIRKKAFGLANQLWMSTGTRTLVDQTFQNAGNVVVYQNNSQNPNSVAIGNHVTHFNASEAKGRKVEICSDLWLDRSDLGVPEIYNRNTKQWEEWPVGIAPPSMPTFALAAGVGTPGSEWTAVDVGTVGYRICAMASGSFSQAAAAQTVAVAAGGSVSLTITPVDTLGYVTGFRIFRETKPGNGIYRWIGDIARNTTVAADTVYVDINQNLPGTSIAILGDFNSRSASDINRTYILTELFPLMKTQFQPGVGEGLRKFSSMMEYYCVPQIFTPEKFIMFKNVPVQNI